MKEQLKRVLSLGLAVVLIATCSNLNIGKVEAGNSDTYDIVYSNGSFTENGSATTKSLNDYFNVKSITGTGKVTADDGTVSYTPAQISALDNANGAYASTTDSNSITLSKSIYTTTTATHTSYIMELNKEADGMSGRRIESYSVLMPTGVAWGGRPAGLIFPIYYDSDLGGYICVNLRTYQNKTAGVYNGTYGVEYTNAFVGPCREYTVNNIKANTQVSGTPADATEAVDFNMQVTIDYTYSDDTISAINLTVTQKWADSQYADVELLTYTITLSTLTTNKGGFWNTSQNGASGYFTTKTQMTSLKASGAVAGFVSGRSAESSNIEGIEVCMSMSNAEEFTSSCSALLNKGVDTITYEDFEAYQSAVEAYNSLSDSEKEAVSSTKDSLDTIGNKLKELLIADFTNSHSEILAIEVDNIDLTCKQTLFAALDEVSELTIIEKEWLSEQITTLSKLEERFYQLNYAISGDDFENSSYTQHYFADDAEENAADTNTYTYGDISFNKDDDGNTWFVPSVSSATSNSSNKGINAFDLDYWPTGRTLAGFSVDMKVSAMGAAPRIYGYYDGTSMDGIEFWNSNITNDGESTTPGFILRNAGNSTLERYNQATVNGEKYITTTNTSQAAQVDVYHIEVTYSTYEYKYTDEQGTQTFLHIQYEVYDKNKLENPLLIAGSNLLLSDLDMTKFRIGVSSIFGSNTAMYDNLKFTWKALEADSLGATISTSSTDASVPVKMGFDFSELNTYLAETAAHGETLINYGAVLVASEDVADSMQSALKTKISGADQKLTSTSYSDNYKYMFTVGTNAETATNVPEEYYVTINQSDANQYMGKTISAIGYVVTKDVSGTLHYYFTTNTIEDSSVTNGVIGTAVLSLLQATGTKYVSAYEGLDSTSEWKTKFDSMLASKVNSDDNEGYNFTDYKEAVNASEPKDAQKELLKHVHYTVNTGSEWTTWEVE